MRARKKRIWSIGCMLVLCIPLFTRNAEASELELNTNMLKRVKEEAYGANDYYVTGEMLFLKLGEEGCTLTEVFNTLEKYGYSCKLEAGIDTEGILMGNLYFGTEDWRIDELTSMPAGYEKLWKKYNDYLHVEDSRKKLNEELRKYYQTTEWIQYKERYEEEIGQIRIYPDTEVDVVFRDELYDDQIWIWEIYAEDDFERTGKHKVSLEETQNLIERVLLINSEVS